MHAVSPHAPRNPSPGPGPGPGPPTRRTHLRVPALALTLVAAACGGDVGTAEPELFLSVVHDFEISEAAAIRLEQDIAGLVLEPLARGQFDRAAAGLAPRGDFAGRLPRLGAARAAGPLTVRPVEPGSDEVLEDRTAFLEGLFALAPLTDSPARVECEAEEFALDADSGSLRANARLRLRWAGTVGDDRMDLTLRVRIAATRESAQGDWRVARMVPFDARPGERISGGPAPFVDRTAEVGLTFGQSLENAELLQAFVDRHRTLTQGGLSVVDWNGDDRPDLIATRAREQSIVFINDGKSGFVPEPLPIADEHDLPAFALFVDLDGDGREELVAGEASLYEDDRAYAGLWTRTGAAPGEWRHLPRAFAMPNPIGLRRLSVQTVAPLDVDGDGDLDLFYAVYGSGRSRGDLYNTVEAYDGADNHLFINGGALTFTEESAARGITGTGYTYVALAFDADHDGDADLFEGNDFGPNVLWRNEGGRFVADDALGFGGVSAYTMGAALADLEADGGWDLYVSNMSSEEGMRMVPLAAGLDSQRRNAVDTIAHGNMLYSEGTSGAAWTERARGLGIHEGEWAWGCQFVEPFADGTLGLAVTNGFASHRDRFAGDWQTYYWRQVIDDARALQEERLSRDVNGGQARFRGSFNGYERDRFYVPVDGDGADRPWVDAAWMLGLDDDHDGRAIVPFDADGDGDLDLALWTLKGLVYRENTAAPSGWARLRLLERDGSPALGARVVFEHGGRRLARHVALVEGFQSQILGDVHVGLGGAPTDTVDAVEITWADGETRRLEGVAAQQLVILTRGAAAPEARELPRWTAPSPSAGPGAETWARELARRARTPQALSMAAGTPFVLRIHADPPPAPPVDVTLDGRPAPSFSDVRIVDAFLRTGTEADRGLDGRVAMLLDPELFADALGPARVTTVVATDLGRPLRVFQGPVPPEHVAAYCELARLEPPHRHLLMEHGRLALDAARYRDAASLFERATRDDETLRAQDAFAFEGWGRAYVLLGRLDLAEQAYRRAVELDPDYATGWFNLAVTSSQAGRFSEALPALLEARRIEGDTRRVLGAIAEACAGTGDYPTGIEAVEAWLKAVPDDVEMLVLAGNLHAKSTDWPRAVHHFERALSLAPGSADIRAALREARSRQGD